MPILCLVSPGFSGSDPGPFCSVAQDGQVPLAYVRTLTVLSPIVRLPAPAPLPSQPPQRDKRGLAKWNQLRAERGRLGKLRGSLGGRLLSALIYSCGKLPGLGVDYMEIASSGSLPSTSAADRLEAVLPKCKSDAALQPVIDGFVVKSGLQREVWIRVSAVMGMSSPPRVHGMFAVFGRSAAAPSFFGLTSVKPDEELVSDAIDQAARRLAHTLDSGEEQLFAHRSRICIIPAAVTGAIQYSAEDANGPASHSAEPVSRLADVLFQPETGPFTTTIDPDEVEAALMAIKLDPSQFWRGEKTPDMDAVQSLCRMLRIDYLFLSRIADISVVDSRIAVQDVGMERAGIERKAEVTAEAALIRISDMKHIWNDEATGTTVSRTEYVRHNPRIVREGQCAADAARVAYARLRYSLEEFQKRFDRRH